MSAMAAPPRILIEANGVALASDVTRALGEVRVQQRLSMPTLCELTFADPPGLRPGDNPAVPILAPGVQLRLGLAEHHEPLFLGQVTAVERVYGPAHRREVRVRAYDLLHRLRKRQTLRAHRQVSAYDLARELVADLGLVVEAAETGPLWQVVIQHQQTDLELLVEVAERAGLYVTLWEDVLHLLTLEGSGEPLSLVLGELLLEARIELNGDPACRSVEIAGWDPLLAAVHEGSTSTARSGRAVVAEVPPGRIGGSGQRRLVDEVAPDDRHAEALAQAELDARFAREVTLWGVAEGNPRLRPGGRIAVTGVDLEVAGRYVVTEVTHSIDERAGFISEFSTSPPTPRTRPRSAVVSLGVVTRVDDPDGLGRVRATLPTYGDVETDWMAVLGLGAGPGKGLVVLPEVGDQVLVLFAHEDPARGIVLGGLYGAQGPPDSGVEGGAVRRYTLLLPGGQKIQLDDARNAIRVEDRTGSYLDLSPDRVRLHAAVDLEIEAPGRAVAIRGSRIDFESA